jgi:Fe-S cluster assembly iron-binding protein IscA
MLTLTDNAATVVKDIIDRAPGTDTGGLRIDQEAPGQGFAANVVAVAEPGDTVVEAGGARVFLEESAAEALDDKVLDARVDDKGAVMFAIGEQHAGE